MQITLNNDFFQTGTIQLWILVLGLFLPRFALFLAWLGFGAYPPNPLSGFVNGVLWLLFPRFLMAFYIYNDIGDHNIWFYAYLILGIFSLFGESGFVHRRIVRRTTVRRDGSTITTIEEKY